MRCDLSVLQVGFSGQCVCVHAGVPISSFGPADSCFTRANTDVTTCSFINFLYSVIIWRTHGFVHWKGRRWQCRTLKLCSLWKLAFEVHYVTVIKVVLFLVPFLDCKARSVGPFNVQFVWMNAGLQEFSKNLRARWILWSPESWHEASKILGTQHARRHRTVFSRPVLDTREWTNYLNAWKSVMSGKWYRVQHCGILRLRLHVVLPLCITNRRSLQGRRWRRVILKVIIQSNNSLIGTGLALWGTARVSSTVAHKPYFIIGL